jgi:hypothetical protein
MQIPSNPFTIVYGAFWDMLLQHPQIIRDVKEANRIRFDIANNRDPIKTQIGTADLPELCVSVESMTANLNTNSSQSKISRLYSIFVSTGDNRYTEHLAQMEWAIFCALSCWQEKISGLIWKDSHFVTNLRLQTGSAGLSDPVRNRNITGWSSVWRAEVEMHFRTDDLKLEAIQKDNR